MTRMMHSKLIFVVLCSALILANATSSQKANPKRGYVEVHSRRGRDDARAAKESDSAMTVTLQIFTTKVVYGGTDANIYVTLISKSGVTSPKIQLKTSSTFANPFEPGQTDVFSVTVPNNLGPVTSIKVESDNGGGVSPDWALDKIVLINSDEKSCSFVCGCWLSNNRGDKLLVRTLTSSC